jgi:hypothetical protein
MKPPESSEPPALPLMDDAVHLLRQASASTWFLYLAGTVPMVVVLLWFCADMSRGADADARLDAGAIQLALAFLWMKTLHAAFASRLMGQLSGLPATAWTWRRWMGMAVIQSTLQPLGLVALPLSAVSIIPFPWVWTFLQNLNALADDAGGSVRAAIRSAATQSKLWPAQNLLVLVLVKIAWIVAALNAGVVIFVLPFLAKMLAGMETQFTLSPLAAFNSTFLLTAGVIGWMAVDPIIKAVYAIRCFRGLARHSGEDLRARWRQLIQATALAALVLISIPPTHAEEPAPEPPGRTVQAITPAQLGDAVETVLKRPEYRWRRPRENAMPEPDSRERSWFQRLADTLWEHVRDAAKAVGRWLDQALSRWLRGGPAPASGGPAFDWKTGLELLLYGAIGAGVIALVWWIVRTWRRRTREPESEVVALPTVPDLRDESVRADQLPASGWRQMARDLAARGEHRLALRALYLASLAQLAERGIVRLARFKSNLDYATEVARRAADQAALPGLFADNVRAFERVWYGDYPATADGFAAFESNLDRMGLT